MRLHRPTATALLAAALIATAFAAAAITRPHAATADTHRTEPAQPDESTETRTCSAELRSWVVAGWARHLYLEITCPEPLAHLDGRVEFTTAALRDDFVPVANALPSPPLVRGPRHLILTPLPFAPPPDNRLEHTFHITEHSARCLQQDRLFAVPYILTETNSNAALRVSLNECGCTLPPHFDNPRLATPLGEFPGLLHDPGAPVPPQRWAALGFPNGPTPLPSPDR